MPITTGRYATVSHATTTEQLAHRWNWLRHNIAQTLMRMRRDQHDNGGGYTLHREWGRWTLRQTTGWKSIPWLTPATYTTRAITANDRDGANDWGLKVLGLS